MLLFEFFPAFVMLVERGVGVWLFVVTAQTRAAPTTSAVRDSKLTPAPR